jgi:hypothetical protein
LKDHWSSCAKNNCATAVTNIHKATRRSFLDGLFDKLIRITHKLPPAPNLTEMVSGKANAMVSLRSSLATTNWLNYMRPIWHIIDLDHNLILMHVQP